MPGISPGMHSHKNGIPKESCMKKPTVGLLPFYVKLYDENTPEVRPMIDAFHRKVIQELSLKGVTVVETEVCRTSGEFERAVGYFEQMEVDAIVTLHLAYSPSLESEKALRATSLPIIVLDTTPDYTYDQFTDPAALMLNHGIHGVQDMCNLLLRNKKKFVIYAGHLAHSAVLDNVVRAARVASIIRQLRTSRVGIIGKTFSGMGDFAIPYGEMKRDLGISIIPYDRKTLQAYVENVSLAELDAQYKKDCERFEIDGRLGRSTYDRSTRVALGIHRWIAEDQLSSLTINFMESSASNPALPVMPFVACSDLMAQGIGYAGEGDVLTAAFTGALLSQFPETTFTEMFCPDWEHGSVFLSHMGEYNLSVSSGKPYLTEKPFPFTDAENPTVAYSTLKEGRATLINLAPFGDGGYGLTIALGTMLHITGENSQRLSVNGWFRPERDLSGFLEAYSKVGATHHSVLVYGDIMEEMKLVGEFLDIPVNIL